MIQEELASKLTQILGKVTVTPKGAYDSSFSYKRLDIVSENGSSYIALVDNKGKSVTNTEIWMLIAHKGDKGDTGPQGIQGIQGIQGEKGDKGDKGDTYEVTESDLQTIASQITEDANSEFNQHVEAKTTEFDTHVTTKTSDFNTNATNKTNEYNENASTKTTEYNDNATTKVEEFNSSVDSIRKDIDDNTSRIKRIESDLFDSGEAAGVSINVKDSTLAEMQEIKTTDNVNGWKQDTTTGQQLYNLNDKRNFNSSVLIDEDDWFHISYTNSTESEQYVNFMTNISNLLKVDTNYNVFIELKKAQGKCNINLVSTVGSTLSSQFATGYQVIVKDSLNNTILNNICKTLENFDLSQTMLRSFITVESQKSIDLTFRVSVIEDTTVTPETFVYEKFTGGQPSPNPHYPQDIEVIEAGDYELTSCNKNLCDISKFLNTLGNEKPEDTYERVENGFIFQNINDSSRICCFKCNMKKDKTYTLSYKVKQLGSVTANVSAYLPTLNQYFYQNRITPNQDTNIIGFYISQAYIGQDIKVEVTDIQVEEGREATDFEPYQESILPITIPEGQFYTRPAKDWGDRLYTKYIESEKKTHLYLEKNVRRKIINSSDIYSSKTDYDNVLYYTFSKNNDDIAFGNFAFHTVFYSHAVEYELGPYDSEKRIGTISVMATRNNYWVGFPKETTLEEAREKLNGSVLYYQLAEPKTYDLGIYDMLLTYYPETNVFNDFPLPVEIAINYYRDPKKTISQLQEGWITAQQEILQLQTDVATLKEQVATILSNMVATASISEEVIENENIQEG